MSEKNQIEYERKEIEQIQQFEKHVKHFEQIDGVLEAFANEMGFVLEKNQWHRPCRVLRKKGVQEYIIEILQEGDWKKIDYRDDLPHTVIAVGQTSDEKEEFVYRLTEAVAYFVHFVTIERNLNDYLDNAMSFFQRWTPDVILHNGSRSEHPMEYWRKQGGIKIQSVE